MGKQTGFLEYDRKTNPCEAPESRVKHWNEFHPALDLAERERQAARCMDCGVPFCQSGLRLGSGYTGCPLHNMAPEWNDLVYHGNFEEAYKRLHKTNNFPEFTGRVCPALCEAACTCGLHGDAVTVRENELFTVERAYAEGLVKPEPPKVRTGKRVAVVGSGPAGLAAADQLNRRGHSVTVFERSDRVGGLLMYGIPNMKLEKSVVDRRVELMRAEGVEFRTGVDVGRDFPAGGLAAVFDAVILCCGAKHPRDLKVPGRGAQGVYFAVDFLSSTTRSLLDNGLKAGTYISAKGKHVVVVGGGDTGNDCVGTAIRHGCAGVTQLEMMPRPPVERDLAANPWPEWPRVEKTDYGQQEAVALFGHDPRLYQRTVKEIVPDEQGSVKEIVTVSLMPRTENGRTVMVPVPGSEETIPCELLLIAAGFLGTESYIPEAFGVDTDARGNIATAEGSYRTSVPKIFAAGDTRRGQSLVVHAIVEGRGAAREVDEFLMGYTNLI